MCDGDALVKETEEGGWTLYVMGNPVRVHISVEELLKILGSTGQECPIRKKILSLFEIECHRCRYNFNKR